MSLIECQECGKEISDKAVSCPHCSHQSDNKTDNIVKQSKLAASIKKTRTILLIVLFVLIGILIFLNTKIETIVFVSNNGQLYRLNISK